MLIFYYLGKGSTPGLDDTTLTSEAKYPIIATQSGKRFELKKLFLIC